MSSWPDVEGAMKDYLRGLGTLTTALGGQRIFWESPKNPPYPHIVITRVGGGDQVPSSDAPVDGALLSFDCWGEMDSKGRGQWRELVAVVNTLRSALEQIRGRTTLASGVDAFGVQLAGVVRAPDPDNGRPRYTVTAEVTAISS